jgi:hypothetical protein
VVQTNVVHGAHKSGVQKLLFLGSSCIYPREVPQPMKEEMLMMGYLEPTNEPYAISKIAGIKLCESYNRQYERDYRSVMPTNLYGPGDNYHPENSHVILTLLRRFHEAVQPEEVYNLAAQSPAKPLLPLIPDTFAPQKWKPCWATRPKQRKSSAGPRRSPSKTWSLKWSAKIWKKPEKTTCAKSMDSALITTTSNRPARTPRIRPIPKTEEKE